jgi:predicted polyphosphate/ATP-dependent NAD kinase
VRAQHVPTAQGFILTRAPSLSCVGVIANPASGRDIRRLVAGASVFDNAEKGAMVYRLMVGLRAAGVDRVLMMPAGSGLSESLRRIMGGQAGADLPELEVLDMAPRGTAEDTVDAVTAMCQRGVGAIAVLGGDGTNRIVARHCGDIPLCALSTGTNNAFPSVQETTVAGLATGFVAGGSVGAHALRRETMLRVGVGDRQDVALVDVARTTEPWIGARAVWRPETVTEAVIAFSEPGAVGLSSLAALVDSVPRGGGHALHVVLADPTAAPQTFLAPLAPGLVVPVGIASSRRIAVGDSIELGQGSGSLTLDGEREIELSATDRVTVVLSPHGPLVIDARRVLDEAARRGLLRVGRTRVGLR